MTQQWYYKLLGEEAGPISFESLQELAREGHLAGDDEVRTSTSNWIRADQVPQLFEAGDLQEPEDATDLDLDLLLAPSSSQPVPLSTKRRAQQAAVAAAAEPIAEWYYQLFGQEIGPVTFDEVVEQIKNGSLEKSDSVRLGREGLWQTLDKTSQFVAIVTQMQPRPEWYCRILGQVLGPMTFDELQHMTESKSLNPDDEVRHNTTEVWSKADQTRGLLFPKAAPGAAITSGQSSTLAPFGAAAKKREWYYEIVGQLLGPISFQEMMKAVADGTLQMEDKARRGKTAAWGLVMDVPGLVSIEKRSAYLAAKLEASRPKPVAQKPAAPTSAPATPPAPVAAPTPVAATPRVASPAVEPQPAAAYVPPPPAPASSSGYGATGAGSSYGSMASAGRPAGFPTKFKPPQKPGGKSSGMGSKVKELMLDGKVIGAIVVILLVGGLIGLWSMGLFSGQPGLAEYAKVKVIWAEVQKLNGAKAKPAEWAAFKTKREKDVKKLETEIKAQTPGSSKRLLQLMYFCTKDHLPKIMADGNETRYKAMDKDMKEAAKLAGSAKK